MVSECVGEHGSRPECTGTLAGSFYILISKLEEERLGLAWAFESWKHTTHAQFPNQFHQLGAKHWWLVEYIGSLIWLSWLANKL